MIVLWILLAIPAVIIGAIILYIIGVLIYGIILLVLPIIKWTFRILFYIISIPFFILLVLWSIISWIIRKIGEARMVFYDYDSVMGGGAVDPLDYTVRLEPYYYNIGGLSVAEYENLKKRNLALQG